MQSSVIEFAIFNKEPVLVQLRLSHPRASVPVPVQQTPEIRFLPLLQGTSKALRLSRDLAARLPIPDAQRLQSVIQTAQLLVAAGDGNLSHWWDCALYG